MRLATWNVNSLAIRLPQLLDWLERQRPDVMVLQETKLEDEKFPRLEIEAAGWRCEAFGQRTYNGVALLSASRPPTWCATSRGFDDAQARVIAGDGLRGAHRRRLLSERTDAGQRQVRVQDGLARGVVRLDPRRAGAHPELVLHGRLQHRARRITTCTTRPRGKARSMCTPEERAHFAALCGGGPGRRLPPVRTAAAELVTGGTTASSRSRRTAVCASTTSSSACAEGARDGVLDRQADAQERPAERPRAGHRGARALTEAAPIRSRHRQFLGPRWPRLSIAAT